MEISQVILEKVQPLNQTTFEKIRDSEFIPSYDKMGLKQLRDKARNERDLRELYRNRAPYELLQNANDAGAKKAAFVLTNGMSHFKVEGFINVGKHLDLTLTVFPEKEKNHERQPTSNS